MRSFQEFAHIGFDQAVAHISLESLAPFIERQGGAHDDAFRAHQFKVTAQHRKRGPSLHLRVHQLHFDLKLAANLVRNARVRYSWPARSEAASAVHEYIEVFYNRVRRHSTIGGKSPASFEALYEQQLAQAA